MRQPFFLVILPVALFVIYIPVAVYAVNNTNLSSATVKTSHSGRSYTYQTQNYYTTTLGLSHELSEHFESLNDVFRVTGIGNEFKNFDQLKQDMDSAWSEESLNTRQQSKNFNRQEKNILKEHFTRLGMVSGQSPTLHLETDCSLLIIVASSPHETGRLMMRASSLAHKMPHFKHVWLVASPRRYKQKLIPGVLEKLHLQSESQDNILNKLGHKGGHVTETAIMSAFFDELFPNPGYISRLSISQDDEEGYNNDALLKHLRAQKAAFSGYSNVILACTQPFCPEARKIIHHFLPNSREVLQTLQYKQVESSTGIAASAAMITEYLDALKHLIITDHALTSERVDW